MQLFPRQRACVVHAHHDDDDVRPSALSHRRRRTRPPWLRCWWAWAPRILQPPSRLVRGSHPTVICLRKCLCTICSLCDCVRVFVCGGGVVANTTTSSSSSSPFLTFEIAWRGVGERGADRAPACLNAESSASERRDGIQSGVHKCVAGVYYMLYTWLQQTGRVKGVTAYRSKSRIYVMLYRINTVCCWAVYVVALHFVLMLVCCVCPIWL